AVVVATTRAGDRNYRTRHQFHRRWTTRCARSAAADVIDSNVVAAPTADLASHGITTALAASRAGATYRVRIANDETLSQAGVHNGVRLYPVGTLNPVEYLDWPAELERVLAAGAVALRFYPEVQRWSVASQ